MIGLTVMTGLIVMIRTIERTNLEEHLIYLILNSCLILMIDHRDMARSLHLCHLRVLYLLHQG
jgi:hypothetical protein